MERNMDMTWKLENLKFVGNERTKKKFKSTPCWGWHRDYLLVRSIPFFPTAHQEEEARIRRIR